MPSNLQHRQSAGGAARTGEPGRSHETHAPSTAHHQTAERADAHGGHAGDDRAQNHAKEAGHAARPDPRIARSDVHGDRPDPRIAGSNRLIHTAGIGDAHVQRAERSPYLRADAHRDIGRDRAFAHDHERDFHSRHVRDFDRRELRRWRGGLWRNEWHYGRRGWWWQVDGVWYGYPEPEFPYPDDVAPLEVYDTPFVDGPDMSVAELVPLEYPLAVVPGAVVGPVIPPLPATPIGWYRCDQPGGYYPGLDACTSYWALVQNAPMPGE